jgi:hypothetical protein
MPRRSNVSVDYKLNTLKKLYRFSLYRKNMKTLLSITALYLFILTQSAVGQDHITIDVPAAKLCGGFDLTNNGSKLMFRRSSGEQTKDLYLYDLQSSSSSLIATDVSAYGTIDDAGRYLVYGSGDNSQAYIHDLTLQSRNEISQGRKLVVDVPIWITDNGSRVFFQYNDTPSDNSRAGLRMIVHDTLSGLETESTGFRSLTNTFGGILPSRDGSLITAHGFTSAAESITHGIIPSCFSVSNGSPAIITEINQLTNSLLSPNICNHPIAKTFGVLGTTTGAPALMIRTLPKRKGGKYGILVVRSGDRKIVSFYPNKADFNLTDKSYHASGSGYSADGSVAVFSMNANFRRSIPSRKPLIFKNKVTIGAYQRSSDIVTTLDKVATVKQTALPQDPCYISAAPIVSSDGKAIAYAFDKNGVTTIRIKYLQ